MDKYLKELSRIVTELENLCGLGQNSPEGICYLDAAIEDVTEYCHERSQEIPSNAMKAINVEISRKVVLLSYAKDRMKYFGKKKLDYSRYPYMMAVAGALLGFTSRKTLTDDNLSALDDVVILMNVMDEKDAGVKKTLSYRFLRIFLILVIYGSYCNASIVASFILEQFITEV